MTDIHLRRAEAADAQALTAFAARLFRETYAGDTPAADLAAYIGKTFRVELQRAEIAEPTAVVLLAVRDGSILGYAHVVALPLEDDTLLLNRLYVERECRGTGLADRLLGEIRRACGRRGIARLRLTVFEKNARAIAFYRRSGFVATGTMSFVVGADVQRDIEMEMPVDAVRTQP